MRVWGAVGNKMEASQETYFGAKITQASLQIIKTVCVQSYVNFMKAYVEKLGRNDIDIWGSGGESPQKPATFQRIR